MKFIRTEVRDEESQQRLDCQGAGRHARESKACESDDDASGREPVLLAQGHDDGQLGAALDHLENAPVSHSPQKCA